MKVGKRGVLGAALLTGVFVLSACGVRDGGGYGLFAYGCPDGAAKIVAETDWAKAEPITLTIRHNEYTPMIISLKRNQAYVFRFENRDDYAHRFNAAEFFQAVALKEVIVDGKKNNELCIAGLGLPARNMVEARFVAVVDGRYEFEESTILTGLTGDAFGVIHID